MFGLLGFVVSTPTLAWECLDAVGGPGYCWSGCPWSSGASDRYRLGNDLTSAEKDAFVDAANAFAGGASHINRGYDFRFIRGSDVNATSTSGNTIHWRDPSFFTALGFPNNTRAIAPVGYSIFCDRQFDIFFNTAPEDPQGVRSWSTSLPNQLDDETLSFPQIAMHELGHGFGFDHEDGFVTLMNTEGRLNPGGDISGSLRLHENEYVGMVVAKGDSSTGNNIMLSKFTDLFGDPDEAEEGLKEDLNDFDKDWEACPRTCADWSDYFTPVHVHLNGTSSLVSPVQVRWSLSSDGICFDGDDHIFFTESFGLVSNAPAVRDAGFSCLPSFPTISYGEYWVCVEALPPGGVTETSTSDNGVISDDKFRIILPPKGGCP